MPIIINWAADHDLRKIQYQGFEFNCRLHNNRSGQTAKQE